MRIEAVIFDFGGVLTTPLVDAFKAYESESGVSAEQLGRAMHAGAADLDGAHPLFELECGRISESRFGELLSLHLATELGSEHDMSGFSSFYFKALRPNPPMIERCIAAREDGYRMALLTNNVIEWRPLWEPFFPEPLTDLFETVVDSGFEGMRKPEPEIYQLTLERLGGIAPERCLFIDDTEVNCEAARELGIDAVHFRTNEQALAEIDEALTVGSRR